MCRHHRISGGFLFPLLRIQTPEHTTICATTLQINEYRTVPLDSREFRRHPPVTFSAASVASIGSVIASPATGPARATHAASAGNTCMSASMMPRVAFTRHLAQREGRERCRVPEGSRQILPEPWHHGDMGHDRQRLLLDRQGFAKACKALVLKHIKTKSYTPKTNGKAERFIPTALRNGPTPVHIQHSITAKRICRSGTICTIGIVLTAV